MPQWARVPRELRRAIEVVGSVLPFRSNQYVMDQLIDWSAVPDDPIYNLTFPREGMLDASAFSELSRLVDAGPAGKPERDALIATLRASMNPHPAGQKTDNVPMVGGEPVPGLQHKYRETVLFFPTQGQTCHAYCTFCFRWPQFIGDADMRFANKEVSQLCAYLREHTEVTDVLFTGGDPMVMKSRVLAGYVRPILEDPTLEHVSTIRIGTKSVAYWPHRFVSDDDADECLRLFDEVVASGRTLAIMGHYSHGRELTTDVSQEAVRRIRGTGANIRMQSPVIRRVNDDASVWSDLWRRGADLGCIPYYMFVERDTGPKAWFELPLLRVWDIYREAYESISGICRTVRGPSMSAWPGKVHVLGAVDLPGGERAIALQYLQCRQSDLVRRPFFAKWNLAATWFDQLEPIGPADEPFFPQHWPGNAPEDRVPLTVGESDE